MVRLRSVSYVDVPLKRSYDEFVKDSTDVVIFGGTAYLDEKSSVQKQMAQSLARLGCRVLYSEKVSSKDVAAGEPENFGNGQIFVHALQRTPFLPLSFPGWNRQWNMVRNRITLRKRLQELEFRDFVVLHYGWFSAEIARSIGQRLDVLDCIDADEERPKLTQFPWLKQYVIDNETKLLKKVDGLIMTSPALKPRRTETVKDYIVLPNAVDASMFPSGNAEPAELRTVPHPRAALLGVMGSKIDLDLVANTVSKMPALHVVVLGPVNDSTRRKIKNPRIHFLGSKPYSMLPSFLSHCELGMIPLTDTPYNRASCPLKLLEYLASGIPVASVPNPAVEAIAKRYPGLVFVASRQNFDSAIEHAIKVSGDDRTVSAAREVALLNSWDQRAASTLEFIKSL